MTLIWFKYPKVSFYVLRFLATGDSLMSIAYGFRIGKSTAHIIIKETCDALWDILQPIVLKVNFKKYMI